ncbi:olfactory receptor 1020-like [Leopardus geoffroyi]|uniref:olfactory receptor 1020-like n=1 Tax=Leopardus geoffroyi TaxID=46844 RepID=UPI001E2645B3|nr:olfactory receptor 1020-like [Leopardus geoffroyi]
MNLARASRQAECGGLSKCTDAGGRVVLGGPVTNPVALKAEQQSPPGCVVPSLLSRTCNGPMGAGNTSKLSEFFIVGLTDDPHLQPIFFALFLLIYAITVVGNLGLLALIVFFLLASMAYDRHVAICSPLLYHIIMSPRLCLQLVAASYAVGLMNMVLLTSTTFYLTCKSLVITHYFCDIPPLLKLSCSDTQILQLLLFACGGFNVSVSLTIVLVSYAYAFLVIIRIPSAKGKHKTFSTCASHLTSVSLYYGTTAFIYLRPSSEYLLSRDRLVSVSYTVVIPMLT